MNQKFLSGLTATLLMATLGILPSYADQLTVQSGVSSGVTEDGSAVRVPASTTPSDQEASTSSADADSLTSPSAPSQEAVKVGEYQSQEQASSEQPIAVIHSHELSGRRAATLYVRDIPVLTFLGAETSAASSAAAKTASAPEGNLPITTAPTDTKVASTQPQTNPQANANDPSDPVWRATEIAARLNQLRRDNVDANTITVAWDQQQQSYLIKAGERMLVQMTPDTILPNSTQDPIEDALQATNLIRRQVGNAPPLEAVTGAPQAATTVSLGPVRLSVSGWASWYGPGFDGNYSASGEVFNQDALTAAHPDLPFGTQVRVTNMDNGQSVVVRINDRGPYASDRIIDLSRGAAAVIGLVQSGVAPVTLEVLDSSANR